jgi:alkylation response protein AidB-like acyl-CoA dehydrogenase
MQTLALNAARDLLPLIVQSRNDTESSRRIAAPVVQALKAARLCRIALPRALGGLELPTPEALAIYEVLAGAEASVGWIVWNNALPSYFGRFFTPEARAEVFGDPDWWYAGSTRPSGKAAIDGDGYRVSGRWSLVSGCELAEWLALRCAIEENGQVRMLQPGVPEVRMVYLRRGSFEILDTWHTGGLRGTGSHDVVVKDQFVSRRHTLSPLDGSSIDGTLGRLPIVCNMAAGYGAQLLGMARACLDALVALAREKPVVDPGPALGERPAVLALLAEYHVRLEAAREHLHASASRLWEASTTSRPAIELIAAVFGAAHHAMAQGRAAVSAAHAAAGASSLYTSSPLERAHRDLHAMAAHVIAQPLWLEDTGRALLGLKTVNPLYLV